MGGGGGGGTALSRVVQVDQATIQYRHWIHQSFPMLQEDLDQSPTPPLPCTRTLPTHLDLDDGRSESSSGSPGSCRSSSPEPEGDQRNSSVERGSSPDCEDRASPQPPTSPTSAMSISPASSEVGTRLGPASLTSSSPPSSTGRGSGRWQAVQYKSRYAFSSASKTGNRTSNRDLPARESVRPGPPDRSDLDRNWRSSASGPPSGPPSLSSNSGSEGGREWRGDWEKRRSGGEGEWIEKKAGKLVVAKEVERSDYPEKKPVKSAAEKERENGRSDRDTNWRDHKAETEVVTSLPPSGCKKTEKNRVNGNQRSAGGPGKSLIKTALKAIENEAKATKNSHNIAEATKQQTQTEQKQPANDNERLKSSKEKGRVGTMDRRKSENGKNIAVDTKSETTKPKPEEDTRTKAEQVADRVTPTEAKDNNNDEVEVIHDTRTKAEQVASRVTPTEAKNNNNKTDYQVVECENGAVKRKLKKKKKKSERPTCLSSAKVVLESTTNNELKSKSEKNDSNAKSNSSSKNAGNRVFCEAGPRKPKR